MNNLKSTDTFIAELVGTFPKIKDEILDEDYEGLITLQIACFKRFTQNAIDNNQLDVISKCFNFVNTNIGNVGHQVENALYISYLGKLDIKKDSEVEKLMPNDLKKVYDQLVNYNSTPSKNNKLNNFLKDL